MFVFAMDNPTILSTNRTSLSTRSMLLLLALLTVTFCTASRAADTIKVGDRIISYWPSSQGSYLAEFQFDIKGYRNTYSLDCKNRQFLWKINKRNSTGEVTNNTRGAEWRPLNPKSTTSNAVYQEICPQLLAGDISAPELSTYTPQKENPGHKAIEVGNLEAITRYLRDNFPETYSAIWDNSLADRGTKATQSQIAYVIAQFISSPEVGATILQRVELDAAEFLRFATTSSSSDLVGAGLNFTADVGVRMAEEALVSTAAALATDVLFQLKPMQEVNSSLERPLRALIEASLVEMYDLQRALKDPTVLVGKVFDRYNEIIEIVESSRALASVQDRGLLAAALSVETSATLVTKFPGERSDRVATDVLRDTRTNIADIVGKDDETAVWKIMELGYKAIRSQLAGDREKALALVSDIRELGRRTGNINPFSAIRRPVDWLTAAANWGEDSPERAAHILIGSTVLTSVSDVSVIVSEDLQERGDPSTAERVMQDAAGTVTVSGAVTANEHGNRNGIVTIQTSQNLIDLFYVFGSFELKGADKFGPGDRVTVAYTPEGGDFEGVVISLEVKKPDGVVEHPDSSDFVDDMIGGESEVFVVSTPQGVLEQEQTLETLGCKHRTRVPADNIRWTGSCVDGQVSGAGEMTYISNDLVILIVNVGPDSDVEIVDGGMVWARNPPYKVIEVRDHGSPESPGLWVKLDGAGGANLHLTESIERIGDFVRKDPKTIDALKKFSRPTEGILATVYTSNSSFEQFSIDPQSGLIREFHNNEEAKMSNRLRALNRDAIARHNQEAEERQKVLITQRRAEAEKEWPKRWQKLMVSDGPWPNTADQLRHDLGAALNSLRNGRPIIIEAEEVGFSNDSVVVTTYQRYTDIYEGIPKGKFKWSDWFDQTSAASSQQGYYITCIMDADVLATMKAGQTYVVDAALTALKGERVSLACTKPRSATGSIMANLMKKGKTDYDKKCAGCHQSNGVGLPPAFPALKGSVIVTGDIRSHLNIVLNGKPGTAMVSFGWALSDAEIAAIVTYERNAWGNDTGDVVLPSDVAEARRR